MKNSVSYFHLLHTLLDALSLYCQNFSRGGKRATPHPRRFKCRPQVSLRSSTTFPQRILFLTQPLMHRLSPLALKRPTSSTPSSQQYWATLLLGAIHPQIPTRPPLLRPPPSPSLHPRQNTPPPGLLPLTALCCPPSLATSLHLPSLAYPTLRACTNTLNWFSQMPIARRPAPVLPPPPTFSANLFPLSIPAAVPLVPQATPHRTRLSQTRQLPSPPYIPWRRAGLFVQPTLRTCSDHFPFS
jgi:hypothetical protein